MNTAAFCRKASSSSGGIPSRFEGVEMNFSAGKIQLNLAFGNAGADELAVVVEGCIGIVLEIYTDEERI